MCRPTWWCSPSGCPRAPSWWPTSCRSADTAACCPTPVWWTPTAACGPPATAARCTIGCSASHASCRWARTPTSWAARSGTISATPPAGSPSTAPWARRSPLRRGRPVHRDRDDRPDRGGRRRGRAGRPCLHPRGEHDDWLHAGGRADHGRAVAERGTRRLLGVQIVGGHGAGKCVGHGCRRALVRRDRRRPDVMDLAYAPPFATSGRCSVAARRAADASLDRPRPTEGQRLHRQLSTHLNRTACKSRSWSATSIERWTSCAVRCI